VGPDGVRFLSVGKICSVDKLAAKRSLAAMTEILLGLGSPDLDVLADLEAGLTTPFEGYHSFAHTVVVVVGPAWKSALTARRLLPMVGERDVIVAGNRFGDEPDHPGLAPEVRVPFDPCVAQAERQGRAPMNACPTSPAMSALGTLAGAVLSRERAA
jgi:CO dehydrogenase nickel-insertion accessory protein CooC1